MFYFRFYKEHIIAGSLILKKNKNPKTIQKYKE